MHSSLSMEHQADIIKDFIVGREKMLGIAAENSTEPTMSVRAIGKKYGCSHQTVCNVVARHGWRAGGKRSVLENADPQLIEDIKALIPHLPEKRGQLYKIACTYNSSVERIRRIINELKAQSHA